MARLGRDRASRRSSLARPRLRGVHLFLPLGRTQRARPVRADLLQARRAGAGGLAGAKRPTRREWRGESERLGLSEAEIEAVATRVADLLREQQRSSSLELVDAAAIARQFGVSRDFVYQHADELGAVRL